ncbi:MAG: hypothetical protein ABI769_17940 [Pseudomonadota bacterium]
MKRTGLVLVLVFMGHALAAPIAPQEHRRGEEQTFLTFPEWFLVFSPAEYAQYVKHEQPSGFPFWGHIRQFWQSYGAVNRAIQERDYPPNPGYHVMINTIGVSTTVEYAIRSGYETIVGRLAELTTSGRTSEDEYAAVAAQDYVDFIRERPWYEFDFWGKLHGLWVDVPMKGDGLLRKLERRYALTTEYVVKALYGWLIEQATHAGYERPLFVTHVAFGPASAPQTTLLPRYEAFTAAATGLAQTGVDFDEVAGNGPDADVLLSVLVAPGWRPPPDTHELFVQPILTVPGVRRVALTVAVKSLAACLRDLAARRATIEHVFDY